MFPTGLIPLACGATMPSHLAPALIHLARRRRVAFPVLTGAGAIAAEEEVGVEAVEEVVALPLTPTRRPRLRPPTAVRFTAPA